MLCALLMAGCVQSDGAAPPAEGDVPDRVSDVSRDLLNLAGLDNPPVGELRDDLALFAEPSGPDAVRAIDPLTDSLAEALRGLDLDEPEAEPIANTLWLVCAAQDFSDSQMEAVLEDLRASLVMAGVTDALAQRVVDDASVAASFVARERRWYEVF